MPQFAYEALNEKGAVTRGEASAANEFELENQLRDQGQYLIRATAREADSPRPTAAPNEPKRGATRAKRATDGKVHRKEILAFTEYLYSATQAGLPILTTLADVELQLETKKMRAITAEIRRAMAEEGKTLSEAMAEHPGAFSRVYLATIEAGEMTGQLDYALQQLVSYLEWNRDITLQIRQATLYPIIVLCLTGGLIVLLVVVVYPRLLPIFTGFDVDLPWPTRVVMTSADFLRAEYRLIIGGIVAAVVGWRLYGATPGGRMAIDSLKLKIPIFGRLIHDLEMARLVTYMSLFYRTGVDLLLGLGLLEQMMTNSRISRALGEVRQQIAGGESIAHALAGTNLFPTIVVRSFALGESTGRLDESLERARTYYAREVPAAVRRMLTALQPLLIVFLGAIIGLVAMSIFLPIMRIYQAVGQ